MIITSKWKKTLVYVVLAIFTLISLYPFYMMLIMGTYTTYNLADSVSMLPGGHLMENLKTVFGNGFMVFYKNSFYLATATTLLSLVVSSLTGYGISKFKFRGARALTIFVIAAMMIPMQVGMIGYLTEIQWLHLNGTREAIIMFYAANCFGTFWIAQYCRSNVPNEVIESARIDGAGEFRIFVQVVLPYLKPGHFEAGKPVQHELCCADMRSIDGYAPAYCDIHMRFQIFYCRTCSRRSERMK